MRNTVVGGKSGAPGKVSKQRQYPNTSESLDGVYRSDIWGNQDSVHTKLQPSPKDTQMDIAEKPAQKKKFTGVGLCTLK